MINGKKQRSNHIIERYELAQSIEKRMEKWRRKTKLTDSDFCDKYGFLPPVFCRWKKLVQIPHPEFAKRLEHAFKKEGV